MSNHIGVFPVEMKRRTFIPECDEANRTIRYYILNVKIGKKNTNLRMTQFKNVMDRQNFKDDTEIMACRITFINNC